MTFEVGLPRLRLVMTGEGRLAMIRGVDDVDEYYGFYHPSKIC